MSRRRAPALAAAGLTAGCGLLTALAARPLLHGLGRRPPSTLAVRTAQVLGARQVVQGVAVVRWPRGGAATAAVVDLLHALSMVALALADRRQRRPALASAAVAGLLCAANVAAAASATRPGGPLTGLARPDGRVGSSTGGRSGR